MTMLEEWMEEAETICNHLIYTNDADSRDYQDNKKILALGALVKAYREAVDEKNLGLIACRDYLRFHDNDNGDHTRLAEMALAHQVDEERFLK